MRYLSRSLILFLLQVAFVTEIRSQNSNEVVSGIFSNITFQQLVKELESKTDYRFFYIPAVVDSLRVNAEGHGKKMNTFLREVLQGTSLHYTIDEQKRIYITKGQPMQASLPDDFFDRGGGAGGGLKPSCGS